ncbi:MAG: hypothetical protein ACRD1A_05350, partial [Terriglobales bacterium]
APRVASTHLHDNHGAKDEHLWPGEGSIAWAQFAPRLAAQRTADGAELPWLLEVGDQTGLPDLAGRIRRTFDRLQQPARPADG